MASGPDVRRREAHTTRHSGRVSDQALQKSAARTTAVEERGKEKTFMDRWVEPSLAAPSASYQDHGGLAYGVLEHMQPLGEMPNAKVKTRVKTEGARKSMAGRVSAVAPIETDTQDEITPEGSPTPLPEIHIPSVGELQLPGMDDENDDDYAPHTNGKKKERSSRAQATKRSLGAAPVPDVPSSPVALPPRSSRKRSNTKNSSTYDKSMLCDDRRLRSVLDVAKSEALAAGNRQYLAEVTDVIYTTALTDKNLRLILEAMLSNRATVEQRREYQVYVKTIRKTVKIENRLANEVRMLEQTKSNAPNSTDHKLTHDSSISAQPMTRDNSSTGRSSIRLSTNTRPSNTTDQTSLEPVHLPKPRISLKVRSPVKSEEVAVPKPSEMGSLPTITKSPSKRDRSESATSSLTDFEEVDASGQTLHDSPSRRHRAVNVSTRANGHSTKDYALEKSLLAPTTGPSLKRSSAEAELDDQRERSIQAKKLKMQQSLRYEYDVEESHMRPSMEGPSTRPHTTRLKLRTSTINTEPRNIGTTTREVKMSMDPDSPLSELSPLPSSQESTPRKNGTTLRLTGKRAKTKQSPEKKAVVAYGAISGASGVEGESPIGDDDQDELGSENNDFCSACSGSGYLLCCDGCDRSFHFTCLDPPLSEDAKELDEPWYCFVCVAKRPTLARSPEKAPHGLFAPLLNGLKKKNPTNFALPQDLRDYFEGVSADKNGAFVEAVRGKPTRSNRAGYTDDQPDYFRTRDAKGNLILCYHCSKSAANRRAIVVCDYCTQPWHLDCLDPPLANPPALNQGGHKIHDWMCPLHADHEMRNVDVSRLGGRTLHVRRPKHARVVETALSRGLRNNGFIEVASDDDESSDDEFYEHDDGRTVHKLPAHGIKLDFIDKVKHTRIQQIRNHQAYHRFYPTAVPHQPSALAQANFAKRSFDEKHVALALAQFATNNQDLNLGSDLVENLVGTLIAEAPPAVVQEMMALEGDHDGKAMSNMVPPSPPASDLTETLAASQRRELLLLQELIRRRLESSKT